MITAVELIEEYTERYGVDKLEAINMIHEDLATVGEELARLRTFERMKKQATEGQEGDKNSGS